MKRILCLFILSGLLFPVLLKAQIEKVIVETYYVSDDYDGTDTTGGKLVPGSKTYRVFIDLKPGCKLKKIYGDVGHTLKISSTADFFNNIDGGQSFAKDFSKNSYGHNTVALDSWLTLGQTTRIAAKTYFGVLKSQDKNGSFIGGANNDGGSAAFSQGLLNNNDATCGIPLTDEDGMDTMVNIPSNWLQHGITDFTGTDTTIFGSLVSGAVFISNDAYLQNSGVMGVNRDSNQVLVAQLTTKGEISFALNVVVEQPASPNPIDVSYVAKFADGETNSDNLKLSPFLTYPLSCGCKDPNYLEYSASYGCDDEDACKARIVYGCLDPLACNYDRSANFNIQGLCCYPGYCNDRDLSVVCPLLNSNRYAAQAEFILYPNPAQDKVTLQIPDSDDTDGGYEIYDSFGKLIIKKDIGVVSGGISESVDVSKFAKGLYMVHSFHGNSFISKMFVKN